MDYSVVTCIDLLLLRSHTHNNGAALCSVWQQEQQQQQRRCQAATTGMCSPQRGCQLAPGAAECAPTSYHANSLNCAATIAAIEACPFVCWCQLSCCCYYQGDRSLLSLFGVGAVGHAVIKLCILSTFILSTIYLIIMAQDLLTLITSHKLTQSC